MCLKSFFFLLGVAKDDENDYMGEREVSLVISTLEAYWYSDFVTLWFYFFQHWVATKVGFLTVFLQPIRKEKKKERCCSLIWMCFNMKVEMARVMNQLDVWEDKSSWSQHRGSLIFWLQPSPPSCNNKHKFYFFFFMNSLFWVPYHWDAKPWKMAMQMEEEEHDTVQLCSTINPTLSDPARWF